MASMEELRAIVAELGIGQARIEKSMDGLVESIKELRVNQEASAREFDKRTEEFNKWRRETNEEFEKWRRETNEEFNRKYGFFGDRLGEITELVVIPGVRPALSKLGHNFDRILSNKVVKKPNGERAVEVDLFLDNGKEAMAVEIKTRLATGMIDGHISRLQKLRMFENGAGIKNKKLYGAVAGIIIDGAAQKYALKNGLYVIEIIEDEYRLKAKAPVAEKIRTW